MEIAVNDQMNLHFKKLIKEKEAGLNKLYNDIQDNKNPYLSDIKEDFESFIKDQREKNEELISAFVKLLNYLDDINNNCNLKEKHSEYNYDINDIKRELIEIKER